LNSFSKQKGLSSGESIMEDEHASGRNYAHDSDTAFPHSQLDLLDGAPLSSSPRSTQFQYASIMEPSSSEYSASLRRAARELLGINYMRGRGAIVDVRPALSELYLLGLAEEDETEERHDDAEASTLVGENITHYSSSYGALEDHRNELQPLTPPEKIQIMEEQQPQPTKPATSTLGSYVTTFLQQTSAVAVVCLLNMMTAIPFGASYFPVQWSASAADGDQAGGGAPGGDGGDQDGDIHGTFPLPGKVALGIRMFFLATIIGQLVLTFASKFSNPVSLQMIENVPFLHALCYTVIREQGYGVEALSTLFFLFGLSSIVVGITFYTLGALKLGRVVYLFPNHVLVGCIGGIGVFMVVTSIEVTNNSTISFDMDGARSFLDNFYLFRVILGLEATLRILMWATEDKNGRPKFQMLCPVFYCMITPLFYLGLALLGISTESATDAGYFFPPAEEASKEASSQWSIFTDEHIWDIFRVVDIRTVSWTAVFHSIGTMVALAAFSLIHVPINIPAFAISTDVGKIG
jgi:SulP family sulfate permease